MTYSFVTFLIFAQKIRKAKAQVGEKL